MNIFVYNLKYANKLHITDKNQVNDNHIMTSATSFMI